jgi:hypothetical protein
LAGGNRLHEPITISVIVLIGGCCGASQGQSFKIIFNVNGPGLVSFKSEMSVF